MKTIKQRITLFFCFAGLVSAASGCSTAATSADNTSATSDTAAVISIGGSAETYEVLERMADAYRAKSGTEFEFFPPSQTSSGVEGVKNGTFDIGAMSQVLTAADEQDGLTYVSISMTPLVVVVNDSVQDVTDITAEQLKAIYKGDISNWQALGGPDAAIALFDVSEDESEKQLLRDVYLGADLKVSNTAITFAEDDEMLETAAITDFSIAAVPLEDELGELPVRILSIDGTLPSAENVASGAYPMKLPLGVAISTTPTSATETFVDFVMSDEGQVLINDDGDDE